MSFSSFMKLLEDTIAKAEKEKLWGTIIIEIKDGKIVFLTNECSRKIQIVME